jgi:hypothetical protein
VRRFFFRQGGVICYNRHAADMAPWVRNRRAALDGLSRILDAGAPEELFTDSNDEAWFLYELLVDSSRGRSSSYYWEICRAARRHGVTPEYVVDRASVLLAAMNERRRTDLYRILGVQPLSSAETIRQRWLEIAKRHHPDVGGDGAIFRHAKQAYEILRDDDRRAEYERFWVRALGPFERVARRQEEGPLLDEMRASARSAARPAPEPGLGGLRGRLEAALAPIRADDLRRLASEVDRAVADVTVLRDQLAAISALKASLESVPSLHARA